MSYYTGPGTYSWRPSETETRTVTISGLTLTARFQIGDSVYADVEVKGIHKHEVYHKQGDPPVETDNYSYASNNGTLVGIYGTGDTYDATDIQSAEIGNTGITINWSPNTFRNNIVIPDGITSIGNRLFYAFGENSSLYVETHGVYNSDAIWVYIDDSVDGERVESYGFLDRQITKLLLNVSVGSGVKTIGDYAFFKEYNPSTDKTCIGVFTVAGDVESIGLLAFNNQAEIEGIDFHESPIYIGIGAFNNCYKLQYINISDDWHNTGTSSTTNTFNNCYKLERISPKNVIKNLRGNNYFNCNSLSQITIKDEDFEYRPGSNSLKVDLYAGSVLDEDGYFITEVNENSVINPYVLAYNWKSNWHRIIAYYTDVSLFLYHKGKRIEIRMYSRGDIIALTHKDIIYYLKTVELIGDNVRHNQTPVFVTHKGKWIQICY